MGNFSEEQNRLLDAIRKMEADGVPEDKIRQVVEYAKQKNPSLVSGKAKQQPAFSLAPPPEPKMKGALGAIEAQGIEVPTKPSGETMPDIGKEESRLGFIGRSLKDLVLKEAPRGLGMAGSFIAPWGISPAGKATRLEAAAEIEEVKKQRRQDYPKMSVKPATDVFSNPTDLDAWTAAAATIMPTVAAMATAPITGGGSAAALTGSYFGSSLANSYTEGIKSGLDDNQSMLYGTVIGSIEAAAENLGLDALTKIPKSWLSKTVKESVKKYGKDGAEKTLKESMKAITAWLAKRGVGAAQGSAVGFLEEGATSLGQSGTQLAFDAATGSELFDPNKQVPQGGVVGEVFGRALEAGAGGVIGEGLIGGVRGIETRDSGKEDSSLDELEQARQKELEEKLDFLAYNKKRATESDKKWQRKKAKKILANPREFLIEEIEYYEGKIEEADNEKYKDYEKYKKDYEYILDKTRSELQLYDEINAKYEALASPDVQIDETDLEALSEPPVPPVAPPIDPTAPVEPVSEPVDPNTPEGAADIATEVLTQKADELDEDLAALSQLDEEVVTDEVDRVEQALQGYRETEEFDDEQLEAMRPFFEEIYNLDDELAAITSKEAKDSLGILKKKYSQRKKDIGKRRKEIDKAISDIAEGNFARASTAAVVEEDLPELMADLADVATPVVAAEPVMGEAVVEEVVTPTEVATQEEVVAPTEIAAKEEEKPTNRLNWREAYKKADPYRKASILREIASSGNEKELSDVLDMLVKRSVEEGNIAWEVANRTKSRDTFERAVSNRALKKSTTDENINLLRSKRFGDSPNVTPTEIATKEEPVKQSKKKDETEPVLEGVQGRRDEGEGRKESAELRTQEAKQEEVDKKSEIPEMPNNLSDEEAGNWLYNTFGIAMSKGAKKWYDKRKINPEIKEKNGNKIGDIVSGTTSDRWYSLKNSKGVIVGFSDAEDYGTFAKDLETGKVTLNWTIATNETKKERDYLIELEDVKSPAFLKKISEALGINVSPSYIKKIDSDANAKNIIEFAKRIKEKDKLMALVMAIDFEKKLRTDPNFEDERKFLKTDKEGTIKNLKWMADNGLHIPDDLAKIADVKNNPLPLELSQDEKSTIPAKQEEIAPPLSKQGKADVGGSNTPTISDFEAISAKGEKGRKARAELTKRLGKDTVNDMTRITANFESIINNLENQGKIRKECP